MLLHATGLRGGRGRVYERLTEKASPRWVGQVRSQLLEISWMTELNLVLTQIQCHLDLVIGGFSLWSRISRISHCLSR